MTLDLASLRISANEVISDISEAIISLERTGSLDSLEQLTLTITDPSGVFANSPLAARGSLVTWHGEQWQVAGLGSSYPDDNTIAHTITCRSIIARSLRRKYGASVEKNVSPSQWVARRVSAAGGIAICQPSSGKKSIAQTSGEKKQSDLDVIGSLASTLEWSWVEWGGRFWFCSRHWAWEGNASGQRTWQVTRGMGTDTDAIAVDIAIDDDDTSNTAAGSITVPYRQGLLMRPIDLISLAGHGSLNGVYLIESSTVNADPSTTVTLDVAQPRRPSKKSGSST